MDAVKNMPNPVQGFLALFTHLLIVKEGEFRLNTFEELVFFAMIKLRMMGVETCSSNEIVSVIPDAAFNRSPLISSDVDGIISDLLCRLPNPSKLIWHSEELGIYQLLIPPRNIIIVLKDPDYEDLGSLRPTVFVKTLLP